MNFENITLMETFVVPEYCFSSIARAYAEAGQSHLVL